MTVPIDWRKSSFSGPDANCVEVAFGAWLKSSYSGADANCVEVANGTWHKSSFSEADSNCVEVTHAEQAAAIRDSKSPDGPHLVVPLAAFQELITSQR